ncbi:MAG: tryptophan 7-halogenase [Kangiellaceae bacterium]|nr:tryptophan 7-halogenase [Kangiellaceae bacterium]
MNKNNSIKTIVIVGGGSAGWMTAAALSKILGCKNQDIKLIESETIGTVSVGEATIPQIRNFNSMLGLDENDFLKHTHGTFKLGIEFVDWKKKNHAYMHPFGPYGTNMNGVHFHHFWLQSNERKSYEGILQKEKYQDDLLEYCLEGYAAKLNKFSRPLNVPNTPLSAINYAFHFDATLYAKYLRSFAEAKGVKRIEGIVDKVNTSTKNGFIESVQLQNGDTIEGELFIDCTGFKGLLIEQTLHSGFDDWSHWLPCNSAVAQASESIYEIKPYTISKAHGSGWQWQIPLQSRVGNGHVYSDAHLSQDEAISNLQDNMPSKPIGEPRHLKWRNGKRKSPWVKNCIAIGLSAGLLEPFESTGLQLIQASIDRLLSLFPNKDFHQADIDAFNRYAGVEIEQIRDFIILHYKQTDRTDSSFWKYCQNMEIPNSLQRKIDLYSSSGRIIRENSELFSELSWLSVLNGQGIVPKSYHPLVDNATAEQIDGQLNKMKDIVKQCAANLPTHENYILKNCGIH